MWEFSITSIVLSCLIIFFASSIKTLIGFGFGLLFVPFLSLIFSPKTVVPLEVILSNIVNAVLLVQCYRKIELKKLSYLLLGTIPGVLFGTYILMRLNTDFLRVFVGSVAIVLALLIFFNISKQLKNERSISFIAGFICGGLKASAGTGAPPVVLLGLNQNWKKETFRATIIGYFTVVNLLALLVFMKFRLFTAITIKLTVIALPIIILGLIVGKMLKNKVSQRYFRKVALILVMLAGISGVIAGLWSALY